MSQAEDLRDKPTKAIKDAMAAVQEGSATSESTCRMDLVQDDGSVLVVISVNGADAELDVEVSQ